MNIGCHVPISKGLDKAPEIAGEWGCEVMQIFTHLPSGGSYCGDKRGDCEKF